MDDKLKKAAQAIIVAIENFSLICGQKDYTDTGDAWQLLDDIRLELMEALHEIQDYSSVTEGSGSDMPDNSA